MMGDQAMESLGTEARGGTRLRLEEKAGAASATKGGRSCFYYERRKELLLLRREEGAASATKGGRSCFCNSRG